MKIVVGICVGYAAATYFGPKINPLLARLYAWAKRKLGIGA